MKIYIFFIIRMSVDVNEQYIGEAIEKLTAPPVQDKGRGTIFIRAWYLHLARFEAGVQRYIPQTRQGTCHAVAFHA